MAAAASAAGRKPPKRRRRKARKACWSKSPRRPPPPQQPSAPPGTSSNPAPEPLLPAGAEVEVRVDASGFGGSWFEAMVVGFSPARRPRIPARYTVTYEHLLADDDGGLLAEHFAPTHIRPRPPPPSDDFPPRFRHHDIVEAFHKDGWWSGIVVRAPGSPDPDATVTVAFPLTREVIPFPPRLVRPRRDYVAGDWVPSRTVVAVRPERKVKVYQVGEKVEARRDRDVYGHSWFPATVAKVVDDLSYIVEYVDLDEEGDGGTEKATEYLEWRFIRPAVEHFSNQIEFQLVPGAPVEAYCDGAWSPGVVRRVVGDGEYQVSILGKKAELLVTRVVELLKPQYKWNGKQWKIVSAKRRANLRRQSMSGQNLSSPVDLSSSMDDYSHDPESAGTKKSREKSQQLDVLLTENSGSMLSENNSLQVTSHGVVSLAPMNGHLCTSPGHSTPQNDSVPNSTVETVDNQEVLSEMMDSDGHLNTHVFDASAGDANDMLSLAVLRKKMALARSSSVQQIQKKVLSVKTLKVKKGISKSQGAKPHPILELQGKNDASDNASLLIMFHNASP